MKILLRNIGLLLPIFGMFLGCQKVVSIDLNEANPQLVIEGVVTDQPGPYQVFLSKTGSYYDPTTQLPTVSGALVILSDDVGQTDTLQEISSGTYQSSTVKGIPGTTYSLSVSINGKTYAAASSMPQKVFIDSLYSLPRKNFDGDTGYDIYITFQDPPEPGNYYRINARSSSNVSIDSIDGRRYRVYSDKLTNGHEMTERIRAGQDIVAGDTITVELLSIDEATYDYFNTLQDILTSDRSPTSLSPANPNSNISNGSLGYFSAYTIDSNSIVLK
jgi:Domain of unknown function (DUF4249)